MPSVRANDWLAVMGEWGTLSKATPSGTRTPVIGGQHFNANVVAATPDPIFYNLRPYVTAVPSRVQRAGSTDLKIHGSRGL